MSDQAPLPGPEPVVQAAAASASSAGASTSSGPTGWERIVYAVGGGRTSFFCMVFLLLLPFFASLPMMIGMRAANGLIAENIGLLILAAMFSILMFLILIEMIYAIRTRIELGEDKVSMTLPAGRGPTPMLRYKSYVIPYDQVHTVESRREIYGGTLAPVLLKGARIVLKDGSVVPLGYVSDVNVDPAIPIPEIAGKIAERARLPLIDRGNVRRSVRRKFLGLKAAETSSDIVEDAEIDNLNRAHSNFMLALIGILAIMALMGLVEDISSGSPIGQTASPETTAPPRFG